MSISELTRFWWLSGNCRTQLTSSWATSQRTQTIATHALMLIMIVVVQVKTIAKDEPRICRYSLSLVWDGGTEMETVVGGIRMQNVY